MTHIILLFLISGNVAAVLTVWFMYSYNVLRRMSEDVQHAEEQMRLHRYGREKVRNSSEEQAAKRMFDTSVQIYEQLSQSYNLVCNKLIYRFPGFVMGFRVIPRKVRPNAKKRL